MVVEVPFECLEGRVSTASLEPQTVLSSAKMGLGSLLLGSRPLCLYMVSRDKNGTEGRRKAWRDRFGPAVQG